MKYLLALCSFFFYVFVPALVFAAPRGALQLAADDLFSSGSIQCGRINGRWVPGRLLPGNFFYARTDERKNVLRAAKKANGSAKTRLETKARNLKAKIRSEGGTCLPGPAVTPTPTTSPIPGIALRQINENLYHTEHSLFIIPSAGQVDFNSTASWDSLYATNNITSFSDTLRSNFPNDYFMIVITASNLQPDRVPNVLTYRQIASGIGEDSIIDPTASNICRYHTSNYIGDGMYAVLDHEIGHNWGVFIGSEVAEGHWHSNSNLTGQMANIKSDDGFLTRKIISGNPNAGFTWASADNQIQQEDETYADQDLYLQGLAATFPDVHVLTSPVYNTNGSVSSSAVNTYDQSWLLARHGPRNPSYRNSEKRFRFGFIYVARNYEEVLEAYLPVERSIRHFIYAEEVDRMNYRFQVPYFVASKKRGSIEARLANLDGNTAPTLAFTGGSYATTTNGSASLQFSAADADGENLTVSCAPASSTCMISGNTVSVSGLAAGNHFFTIKAQDSRGKKVFAHFVVDAS